MMVNAPGSFGRWVRDRRKSLDLTQADLGKQAGYAEGTIRKIEADDLRPSKHLAGKLADCLAVPPDRRDVFVRFARGTPTGEPSERSPSPPPSLEEIPGQGSISNLPLLPGSLIGREVDLARATALVCQDNVRLLTFSGPPGVGKTRLALEVASRLANHFADGVTFVSLAATSDPDLVATVISRALGVLPAGVGALPDHLKLYLREKHVLLVLDNFEQVVAAAVLVADLLAAASSLHVLVTSRECLYLRGEQTYLVSPLSLPGSLSAPLNDSALLAAVTRSAAVQLFVARARESNLDFALTAQNAAAVAEICRAVDGLPLAIELVAARSKILTPQGILTQWPLGLTMAGKGPRDLPKRQRTLRSAIAWSYDLLPIAEQVLLRCVAVFAGGFTLEAAEAVASLHACLANSSIWDGLEALVDRNLLYVAAPSRGGRSARFGILETIREYALERLDDLGAREETQSRHARYFLSLADMDLSHLPESQEEWLARLEVEHDNLRAALRHLQAGDDVTGTLRLAGALAPWWQRRGYFNEGRRWLRWALDRSVGQVNAARARALHGDATLAQSLGDLTSVRASLEEAASLWQLLGDHLHLGWSLFELAFALHCRFDHAGAERRYGEALGEFRAVSSTAGIARVVHRLGVLALERGELAKARSLIEEALAIWQQDGNRHGISMSLDVLAGMALDCGELAEARELYERGLALKRSLSDELGVAGSLTDLGKVARMGGAYGRATTLLQEAVAIERRLGASEYLALTLYQLSLVACESSDQDSVVSYAREVLAVYRALGSTASLAERLDGWAQTMASRGPVDGAVRLVAAAARLRETTATHPQYAVRHERLVSTLQSRLAAEAFHAAWAEGQGTPVAELIERGLSTSRLPT
jgi:predicted ATPase/transcriptional regulator with XRE-family HTH domain